MRIKVTHDTGKHPTRTQVTNAETGEIIEGAVCVMFTQNAGEPPTLVLTVNSFDFDVTAEAEVRTKTVTT